MGEGLYVAVLDQMKYGVKPSAVRSENFNYTTSKRVMDPRSQAQWVRISFLKYQL